MINTIPEFPVIHLDPINYNRVLVMGVTITKTALSKHRLGEPSIGIRLMNQITSNPIMRTKGNPVYGPNVLRLDIHCRSRTLVFTMVFKI